MASKKMTRLLDRFISYGGNTVILDLKDMKGRLMEEGIFVAVAVSHRCASLVDRLGQAACPL